MRPRFAVGCGLGAEFVVTAAHILDERVTFDDDARCAVALQPARPPQPPLQPSMVGFDTIVRVLDRRVQRPRSEFTDCLRQHCGPIGDHLPGLTVITDHSRKEPSRSNSVAPLRHQHVNDLAIVIDGAVDATPHARHLLHRFHRPTSGHRPHIGTGQPCRSGSE